MNFIKVTALQCNPQGNVQPNAMKSELRINKDLICAINDTTILLKGGNIISLGKNYYTDLHLAKGVKIEDL